MKSLKKLILLPILLFGFMAIAQENANRFFYELTFKPKKDSAKVEKVMTTLDIVKDKSVYQDFTLPAQDSIIKSSVEEMEKSKSWKDLSNMIKMPNSLIQTMNSEAPINLLTIPSESVPTNRTNKIENVWHTFTIYNCF